MSRSRIGSVSSSDLIDAKLEQHRMSGSKQCPSCGHKLDRKPDWVGLPAGVKFDPTDQELIEHLEAKVSGGSESSKSHLLIDEFIPTIEGEDGICYTHPEKLPDKLGFQTIPFTRFEIKLEDSLEASLLLQSLTSSYNALITSGTPPTCYADIYSCSKDKITTIADLISATQQSPPAGHAPSAPNPTASSMRTRKLTGIELKIIVTDPTGSTCLTRFDSDGQDIFRVFATTIFEAKNEVGGTAKINEIVAKAMHRSYTFRIKVTADNFQYFLREWIHCYMNRMVPPSF